MKLSVLHHHQIHITYLTTLFNTLDLMRNHKYYPHHQTPSEAAINIINEYESLTQNTTGLSSKEILSKHLITKALDIKKIVQHLDITDQLYSTEFKSRLLTFLTPYLERNQHENFMAVLQESLELIRKNPHFIIELQEISTLKLLEEVAIHTDANLLEVKEMIDNRHIPDNIKNQFNRLNENIT